MAAVASVLADITKSAAFFQRLLEHPPAATGASARRAGDLAHDLHPVFLVGDELLNEVGRLLDVGDQVHRPPGSS